MCNTQQTLIIVNALQVLTWDISLLLLCVIPQMFMLLISADLEAILISLFFPLNILAGQRGRAHCVKSSSIFNCCWQQLLI